MYRLSESQGKWYGLEIDSSEDDAENIDVLVDEGDIVLLCEDLESLDALGIDQDDITIID